ncbi:unnamed protein product [Cylindrotheca closterium]|uniref:Leucine-rich repeat-containing N-terminal plant-type domain-containing protein n=1 Tax=Cylindrotheca closterium TaxID=2856 RepID=A0AAD2PUC5_9STRA|nr:unnamed protein product [Cylindrotheca closterium]
MSTEERTMLADIDIEENRNGHETEIDASGLECDIIPTNEKEIRAGHENTTEAPKSAPPHEKEDHIAIAALAKNTSGMNKCFIICAFAVVAVASGVTGALIARKQSPGAIALSTNPIVPQTTVSPTTSHPTTAPSTHSNPTEEPTSPPTTASPSTHSNPTEEPTSPPTTASPTTLTPSLSPRQSAILDAFTDYGPVHAEAFQWLLDTDEWVPSSMISGDTKALWHQRYAVATLFYSTNVPYLANSAFRTTNSVCEWAGIECSDGLEVDELDLAHAMMSGSIPTEIGMLTGLSYLDFTNNDIGGPLPSEIGLLSDLNDILLSHNSITGSVPSEIGHSSLWFLYADHNKFSGSLPPQLKKVLGVDLSFNQLSEHIPDDLFTDRLSMLILNDNRLSGSLPESLLEASQLTTLWLWNNELTGSIPALNAILSSCKIGNNQFSDTTNGEGFCSL